MKTRAPADRVSGLEAAGRNEPAPGIFGNTVSRPLLQRRPEGVMQRVLREIEVTEETDQRRKDTARFGPIDRVYAVADPTGRAFGDAVPV